jgi:hypothetical protein
MANSSMFSFPSDIILFSFINLFTTVPSYGDIKFSSIFELHVVLTPFVHILSFSPTGIPANSEFAVPFSLSSSIFFALSIASS